MFDFQSKFKRQIEILGLCLSDTFPRPIVTFDLAEYFNVEELTIKRDLQELRANGINIHSKKKTGICIDSSLPKETLIEIIFYYTSLNHKDNALDKSTLLLVEKRGESALSNIVMLQFCINNSEAVTIDYNKMGSKIDKDKQVEPLLIFQNEGSWRLLAGSEGIMKQFHIDKIISVKKSGIKFDKTIYKFSDLFKYSWKSWLGDAKYEIKLLLSPIWAERIKPKILVADQKITKHPDGTINFECTVNSLNEIASWIVSRGEGVKVIEPEELKNMVIDLAKGTLINYFE